MTRVVNIHEVKSRLSELIRAGEASDEIVIARNGRPVAKLCRGRPPDRSEHPADRPAGS